MSRLISKKLKVGFAIVIAAVIANALISYRNTNKVVENNQRVTHTLQVLTELESTFSTLKDAETGQRGYLLTGDTAYLQPHDAAITSLDQQLASLKQLTTDNPEQQRRLAILEQQARNRLDSIRQVITIRETQGLEPARQIVLSGQGKQIMDQIRQTIAEMQEVEKALLEQRINESKDGIQSTNITFSLATFFGLGLLAYLYYLIRRDLLTREQTEAAMQQSEKEFEALYNDAPCGYHSLDETDTFIRINDTELRMLGYTQEEIIGKKKFSDLLTAESKQIFQHNLPLLQQRSEVKNLQLQMIRKDGSILPVILNAVAIKDAAGNLVRSQATILDDTEREQAEKALQEGEERLRLALEAAQMGIWDWKVMEDQIIWSEGHERLFGLVPGAFDGTYAAFEACVHPDDRETLKQSIHRAREQGTDYKHEYRIVWADGSVHWIEGIGELYHNEEGEVTRILGTVTDISVRKQTEEALQTEKKNLELRVAERTVELLQINKQLQTELSERQRVQADLEVSQAQFAGILNIAEDAIISINIQQQITLFNQGAEKIFGYSAAEVIGQPLDLLLPNRFTQAHRQHVTDFKGSAVQARRMGERREIYGQRKDGSEFPAEASISKLKVGQETVFTVFLQDITERKQIDRMKDEFVSVVSHELRTPLTSIHGSLGMLASGLLKPDSDQGKRMLQIAVDSTDRLVRLINDILDIERIESGRVKMEKEFCLVDDLITEAVNVMQTLADKAGVTLSVTSLPVQIWADPDRIVQTLTNLLSNAIKFSPRGNTVWLSAKVEIGEIENSTSAPTSPSARILFSIRDQGRGIPADKLTSIFERFQQVDSSDSRNHEGTGLGLAICRSIVQQHDGEIWVESVLGEGSTFFFTLPLQASQDVSSLTKLNLASNTPLVLVCDDDPAIRTVLQTLLEQRNYRVITAASGQDAIAQATAQTPDVILLDLLMPNLNGWETMSRLKEQPETQNIPIIVCSICSPSETPSQGMDCVDWVSKPLDETLLLRSLKQALAKPAGQLRVLIIEDDKNLAQVLVTLFEQHQIQAFHATTGREAIQLGQQTNPDLLILDLILPEGDGFTVVEWLQQHNRLCNIPLVVYSARDLDASERKRLQLGHTEFLDKGRVTIQEFEQRVMALLQQVIRAEG